MRERQAVRVAMDNHCGVCQRRRLRALCGCGKAEVTLGIRRSRDKGLGSGVNELEAQSQGLLPIPPCRLALIITAG